MKRIQKALEFARLKHKGQKDDTGADYLDRHLFPVSVAVRAFTSDEDVIIAAILHDVLEDTDTTYKELVLEFGVRVADLVHELTDEDGGPNYGKYFPRLKSPEAIMIKLCDRASNISRMEPWDEKRKEQYLRKTKFWKDGSDLEVKQ